VVVGAGVWALAEAYNRELSVMCRFWELAVVYPVCRLELWMNLRKKEGSFALTTEDGTPAMLDCVKAVRGVGIPVEALGGSLGDE